MTTSDTYPDSHPHPHEEDSPEGAQAEHTSDDGGEYGEGDDFGRGSTADTTGESYEPGAHVADGPVDESTGGPVDETTDYSADYDADDAAPAPEDSPVLLPVDPPADGSRTDALPDEPFPASNDATGDVPGYDDRAGADYPSDAPDGTDAVIVAPAPETSTSETSTPEPSTPAATTSADADWHELQSKFVDDPSAAVRDAGALVEKAFADLRSRLETGDDTEDLRTAFRRYRDLFGSLG